MVFKLKLKRDEYDVMRHAVALESSTPGYRAHYCASDRDLPIVTRLEKKGYMVCKGVRHIPGEVYVATLEAAGAMLECNFEIEPEEPVVFKTEDERMAGSVFYACPICRNAYGNRESAVRCCNCEAARLCDECGIQISKRGRVKHLPSCIMSDPYRTYKEVPIDKVEGVFYRDSYYEDLGSAIEDIVSNEDDVPEEGVVVFPARRKRLPEMQASIDYVIDGFYVEVADGNDHVPLLPEEAIDEWDRLVAGFEDRWRDRVVEVYEPVPFVKAYIPKSMIEGELDD